MGWQEVRGWFAPYFQVSGEAHVWAVQLALLALVTALCNHMLLRVLDFFERITRKTSTAWDKALLHAARLPLRLLVWLMALSLAGTLLEIFDTVETNWRRCGDVRYAVTYRPGDAVVDAEDAAKRIADAWSGAMRDRSRVRDFVAVGDVNVSPIGSADALPDPTRTVRMLIEQITAKLGVPPFLLGLGWTTSERMADRQTEIFTRRLAHYRKLIEPALLHVCRTFLRLRMSDADVTIQWEPIAV